MIRKRQPLGRFRTRGCNIRGVRAHPGYRRRLKSSPHSVNFSGESNSCAQDANGHAQQVSEALDRAVEVARKQMRGNKAGSTSPTLALIREKFFITMRCRPSTTDLLRDDNNNGSDGDGDDSQDHKRKRTREGLCPTELCVQCVSC